MIEIAINVGMIKLNARQYHIMGPVMEELRSFIEKSAVILVPFNDHIISFSRLPAAGKIHRYPADKKSRLQSRALKHPSGQRSRGSFAMSACDHQGLPRSNQEFSQSLRKRDIRNSLIQHGLCFRIAARYRVPDNDQSGVI